MEKKKQPAAATLKQFMKGPQTRELGGCGTGCGAGFIIFFFYQRSNKKWPVRLHVLCSVVKKKNVSFILLLRDDEILAIF